MKMDFYPFLSQLLEDAQNRDAVTENYISVAVPELEEIAEDKKIVKIIG